MTIHLDFPRSPYAFLPPERRRFPAAQVLCDAAYEKLWPPLVTKTRTIQIELRHFSVYYTQGALEAGAASLQEGKSQLVCDAGQTMTPVPVNVD